MLSKRNISSLWNYINQGVDFPWPRTQKGKEKISQSLATLIGDDGIYSDLNALDKNAFNAKIRDIIAPKLREGKADQSEKIGIWIVREWGGHQDRQ